MTDLTRSSSTSTSCREGAYLNSATPSYNSLPYTRKARSQYGRNYVFA